ncbi:MAG: hypothetical protein U0R79_10820 [Propionicimonas sp.]
MNGCGRSRRNRPSTASSSSLDWWSSGESAEASRDVFAKVFLTVLVFWAAHVYAGTVAHLGDEPMSGVPLPTRVLTAGREAVVHSWGMLLTSMLPLLVILLGHVGVIDDQQAVWGSLWTSVALLGVLGYAKVAAWTANPGVRLAGGGITSRRWACCWSC